jgi:predicted lipid-binding transport protein (Tim44 family)|tara:strand:- start:21 stop:626 length:606 start_codon:yes stop_codon:yes gene_type:complete
MSNNFGYIDIILLAMIAGFIILRLRSILGKKTGHEEKIYSGYSEKFQDFKKQKTQSPPTILKDKLEGENKRQFLKGAELAYETIITAFAKGDQKKLKSLLTSDMASNFEEAIKQRQSNNIKSELTFIGIKETNLEKFERVKNNFFATVKFVSEIISVKRDKDNKIIEGNPDKIKIVTDHWKFTKTTISQNPNWYLSEIVGK